MTTGPESVSQASASQVSASQEPNDPFSPENAPFLNFIMQARIYDALMALLTEANEEVATQLMELHAAGGLMGPQPAFNGRFVADIVNDDEQ